MAIYFCFSSDFNFLFIHDITNQKALINIDIGIDILTPKVLILILTFKNTIWPAYRANS